MGAHTPSQRAMVINSFKAVPADSEDTRPPRLLWDCVGRPEAARGSEKGRALRPSFARSPTGICSRERAASRSSTLRTVRHGRGDVEHAHEPHASPAACDDLAGTRRASAGAAVVRAKLARPLELLVRGALDRQGCDSGFAKSRSSSTPAWPRPPSRPRSLEQPCAVLLDGPIPGA